LKDLPKPPLTGYARLEKLERLNEAESEVVQAMRCCSPAEQLYVRDAVDSITKAIIKHRVVPSRHTAEVLLLCDTRRKFR